MKRTILRSISLLFAAGILMLVTTGCWAKDDKSSSTPTSTATPTATAAASATGATFNPYPFYSQSCGPEKNSLGGCTWDVGSMGNYSDILGRPAVQIGVVKGVSIKWQKGDKQADPGPSGRCSLVILTPNSWFEDLTVKDANVTIYAVDANDIAGWTKTLAVQNAYEQEKDYKCPAKKFEDIPQWGSPIQSPPCGTPGFDNCKTQTNQQQATAQTQGGQPSSCETVDCKPRVATGDTGGSTTFKAGDSVAGAKITIGGSVKGGCYYKSAPADGTVVDGVVHPWPAKVKSLPACQ